MSQSGGRGSVEVCHGRVAGEGVLLVRSVAKRSACRGECRGVASEGICNVALCECC